MAEPRFNIGRDKLAPDFNPYGTTYTERQKAIEICKTVSVLREYLEMHEKEVLEIMDSIFSQEKATEAYVREAVRDAVRETEIKTYVETLQEVGIGLVEVIQKVVLKFGVSEEVAKTNVTRFWC